MDSPETETGKCSTNHSLLPAQMQGGVEDKGISFMLTPPPGTPSGRGIGGPIVATPGLTPSR